MRLLDTVALKKDIDQLPTGLVGVLVEEWEPGVFEVEFADLDGKAYARAAVRDTDLLLLHHSLGEQKQAA